MLVVHGAGDRYIPARFSEALYNAAPTPKHLLLVENGSHNNSMWMGNCAYQQALGQLFDLYGVSAGEAWVKAPAPAPSSSC